MSQNQMLGWFEVNLNDKKRGPCPGILIWCEGAHDTYWPEVSLEFDRGDECDFFVSAMRVSNPTFEERAEMAKRVLTAIADDPETLSELLDSLRAFLRDRPPQQEEVC